MKRDEALSWISLGMWSSVNDPDDLLGYRLRASEKAIGEIMSGVESRYSSLDYRNCILALRLWFMRGQADAIKKFILLNLKADHVRIGKFVPGDHYHVLDKKFNDFDSAREYLESRGFEYAGMDMKHVYNKIGD